MCLRYVSALCVRAIGPVNSGILSLLVDGPQRSASRRDRLQPRRGVTKRTLIDF